MSFAFSLCTLVNDEHQYDGFQTSAKNSGFGDDCEFLQIDNTVANQTSAYAGLNHLLSKAQGRFVILCHQDILFDFDDRFVLEARLQELTRFAPLWGVCGVAGKTRFGEPIRHITDKYGDDQRHGILPAQAGSLDECFLVINPQTGLRFSRDIEGFHMYGTDICLMADVMGFQAWVVDFHICHNGEGLMGPSFDAALQSFQRKWSNVLQDRFVWTTATRVFLSGRKEPAVVAKLRGTVRRIWLKYFAARRA